MLVLRISLWIVALASLRVALLGNPVYRLLKCAPPPLLQRLDQIAAGEAQPETETEIVFLKKFWQLMLVGLALIVMEVSLLTYLWVSQTLGWLALGILAKNLVLIAFSASFMQVYVEDGLFQSLLSLPRWLVVSDRLSALISGCAFVVFFLAVNGIWFG